MRYLGWLALTSLLILTGVAVDILVPPPSWKNPELLCPSPKEQFAAQAQDFLSDYPVVIKLGLLEVLEDLEKQLEHGQARNAGPESKTVQEERPGAEKEDTRESWHPEDYTAFWKTLSPHDRELLGLNVEPKEALAMPDGLWPIEEEWERFRRRPLSERLFLLYRLDKFYHQTPEQRGRTLGNYRRWRSMSEQERQEMRSRLISWLKTPMEKRRLLSRLYKEQTTTIERGQNLR